MIQMSDVCDPSLDANTEENNILAITKCLLM